MCIRYTGFFRVKNSNMFDLMYYKGGFTYKMYRPFTNRLNFFPFPEHLIDMIVIIRLRVAFKTAILPLCC